MCPRHLRHLLSILSAFFAAQGFGQLETQPLNEDGQDRGAIILASVEGSVFVLKNDSGRPLPSTKIETGTVLYEGHTVVCGKGGKAVLLFSNGSTATLKSDTKLNLRRFRQDTFIATNEKLADLQKEPSVSETRIYLNFGNLVINVKKLDRASSFEIHSPIGTAGIRGTRIELQIQTASGGGFSGKMTVPEGTVAFSQSGTSGRSVATPILIRAGNAVVVSLDKQGQSTSNIVQANILTKDLKEINAELDQAIEKTEKVRVSQIVAAVNAVASAVHSDRAKQLDSKETSPSNEGTEDGEESNAPEGGPSPVEKQASRSNAIDVQIPGGTEVLVLQDIEKRLEKLKQTYRRIEDSISVSSTPRSVFYNYYVGDEMLKITHATEDQVTELKGEDITYENLILLPDADEMTSRTIPVLAKVFESVESITFQDQIMSTSTPTHFNEILGEAVKLAEVLLTEVTLSGSHSSQDIANHPNLYNKAKVQSLLSGNNPYYYHLIKALAANGAFGDSSEGKVGNAVDQLLNSLLPSGAPSNELSAITEKTVGEVFHSTGGNLGGLVNLDKYSGSSLFQVPITNAQGIVGQKITLGEKGTETTIDLSDQLFPNTDTPTDPKDWKIFGIGAGKDLSVKGNVTFTNSNRHSRTDHVVKDHALAIGALDDIHFHSETWEKDWGLPTGFLEQHLGEMSGDIASDAAATAPIEVKNRIKMDFEGANLYIGSVSKLQLVNVDLKSGGNLGVGSLDEVHIVSLDTAQPNVFTAGENSNPAEGDNIQIYANERIVADGLAFEGRVDEIYMEARTVDLKNINFPAGSEIKLASELGGLDGKYPTFGIGDRQTGRVNFIKNVYYDVNQVNGRGSFDDLDPLANGKHPIVIKKR